MQKAEGIDADVHKTLDVLNNRIRTLLPEEYRNGYEDLQPVPMRSTGLKYDANGYVAWDQIWGSFCDLAMAGGPPHKGALLESGTVEEIDAQFDRYDEVAEEICRGIKMVTGLRAYVSPTPGWVAVTCSGDAMADWLVRAITMENVAARRRGSILELPAAPHFRLEKEIKNVVTVVAKTCHYWVGHIPHDQQRAIAELFTRMAGDSAAGGTRRREPWFEEGSRTGCNHRCADSARHRLASIRSTISRLGRLRMSERSRRGVDDARARGEQRSVAAARDRAVCACKCRDRSARHDSLRWDGARLPLRMRARHQIVVSRDRTAQ